MADGPFALTDEGGCFLDRQIHDGAQRNRSRQEADNCRPFWGTYCRRWPPKTAVVGGQPLQELGYLGGRMRRPQYQWQTRQHRAIRQQEFDPVWKEVFRLLPTGVGEPSRLCLSLERQIFEGELEGLDLGDLIHAVSAWLVARGAREINFLDTEGGVLAEGAIDVWGLGSLPCRAPSTVVTLCPSNAEMVAALGCFDRVVACEDSSDDPPEVGERERLGPDLDPDLDRVAELGPELSVASLSVPGMERVVTGLRARALPFVVLAPRSIADVEREILALGSCLGVQARAQVVAAKFRAERDELAQNRYLRPLRVYLEWWPRPMFTPAGNCFSNELIEL
ncbi:MAG TPA: hypothetical protein ENK31_07005, partial [Nannocystis exedens]|nr:hypothetical protein [Nannocystis exedens]